jgi:UDP-2,4-diacetamido-2,4,6-trideoxy-beta-L-altropyranose hydrolase
MKVLDLSVEAGGHEDAKETGGLARNFNAEWIVVDGYHFGSEYQKEIKDCGISLLFVDDYGHADHYYADLVLNQNITGHNENLYQSREVYTQLLLGMQYALLRREFWQWRGWQRVINPITRKLLVTFGGSDPDNVTLKVIQALQLINVNDLEVIVVVGGSNPHYEMLQKEIATSNISIFLQQNVNNMPELMSWADIAIAAGGSTNWELAFMGLPSLVITLADNQKAIAEYLGKIGLANSLGWYDKITIDELALAINKLLDSYILRKEMSQVGQKLIDGLGSIRVVSKMRELFK